jgi:hypothetical protein
MGARNLVGLGTSYRSARLHGLAESIPGLLKSLKIQSLDRFASRQGLRHQKPEFQSKNLSG